jgi:flavodoxin
VKELYDFMNEGNETNFNMPTYKFIRTREEVESNGEYFSRRGADGFTRLDEMSVRDENADGQDVILELDEEQKEDYNSVASRATNSNQ